MKKIRKRNLFFHMILVLVILGCRNENERPVSIEGANSASFEESNYRPNFHFTPKANWMNDPNGMFYTDGVYHLFFQYYPDDNVWGPMHWGHATSEDMVVWEEQPIALYPDSLGYIFSGGAVVDIKNTSGFGTEDNPPVVATFTYHDPIGEKSEAIDFQSQAVAYSLDKGASWIKYEKNPVIPNPGIKDFRDPKVSWDEERQQWVMTLATYSEAYFYSSRDLKSWSYLSAFGKDIGAHGGVWECPDFIQMPVSGSNEVKWVLLQSLNPGSANGGSGTQYFIGDFDGTTFTLDPDFESDMKANGPAWLDYGRDNYAGVTWSNIPEEDGRVLFIGWMSNWDYAQVVPTTTWRSSMTIARELTLHRTDEGFKVHSNPVSELDAYTNELKRMDRVGPRSAIITPEDGVGSGNLKMDFEFLPGAGQDWMIEFRNEKDENIIIGYDSENSQVFVDRSGSGVNDFSEKFAAASTFAPVGDYSDFVPVSLFLDKSSIEIFISDGAVVITDIFFSSASYNRAVYGASNEENSLRNVVVSEINTTLEE